MITLEQLQAGVVLAIDKPYRWTSFQTVNKIKAIARNAYGLKKFKIGHAGTLDPLATGLLLVCLGKATKRISELQDGDKVYTGTLVLGATTPCYDMEQAIDRRFPYEHLTPTLLEETARRFVGTVMQVPPMFSAVKVDGQRAYEYARRDDSSVTIQPKSVKIHCFEITAFHYGVQGSAKACDGKGGNRLCQQNSSGTPHFYDHPQCVVPAELPQADFRVQCGKGTYIRSLARDFGEALGSGAFLSALRREQVGDYHVNGALQLDEVEAFLTGTDEMLKK